MSGGMAEELTSINRRVACRVLLAGGGALLARPAAALRALSGPLQVRRADFSGSWRHLEGSYEVRRSVPEFRPGRMWVTLRTPVTIVQNEKSVEIVYVSAARTHQRVQLTYRLDGEETLNSDGVGASPRNRPSRAQWQDESLVLISVADLPDRASSRMVRNEFRDVLTLESPPTMRVESSRTANGITASFLARLERIDASPTGPAGQ